MQSNLIIPFGDHQGELIATCDLETLDWAINALDRKLRKDPGHKYAAKDRQWLKEAQAVFAERSEGVVVEGPAPIVLMPPAEVMTKVTRSIRSAKEATELLTEAAKLGHLISPAPAVGSLPDGCSVSVSAILVNRDRETYPQTGTGERSLSRVALDRISGAAGIEWDDQKSHRVDGREHPWYCHYKAVGRVSRFDGTYRPLLGECELDMTEDSGEVLAIQAREAAKKHKEGDKYRGDGGLFEISQRRRFILRLTETGARLRAIRNGGFGIRTSYTDEELARPFIMVQLMFDGQSEDPEIRRIFANRIADRFLGASSALYGGAPTQLPPPPARPVIELPESDEEPRFELPNYGFVDLPKATGTDGGKH